MRPLSLLLLLSACATSTSTPEVARSDRAAWGGSWSGVGPSPVTDVSLADHELPHERVFRVASGTSCPPSVLPAWDVDPLFPGAPGPLSTYCRAVWTHSAPPFSGDLPSNEDLEAVVVAPMSGTEFPTAANVDQHTRSRTVPVDRLPNQPAARARLAILDAVPTEQLDGSYFSSVPAADHGHRVATIAEALVCDSFGECAVDLVGYSALQYRYDESLGTAKREANGVGVVGSQSDLARAIYEAVHDWSEATNSGPLVLNISAGWHGHWGGSGSPSSFDVNVAAVHEALVYASCHGALVFAAAGNLGGLVGDVDEPLYPAAWERFQAPSNATCRSDYQLSPGGLARGRLVYAVGAVDANHEPLGMSRPESVPMLVAAGSHVGLQNPVTSGAMDAVSGTSASTAVVSASAALVRTYRPNFSARNTVSALIAGADAYSWNGPVPEFCPAGGAVCSKTHVVTPCHSLLEVCPGGGCPAAPECTPDPAVVPLTATKPTSTIDWSPTSPVACPSLTFEDPSNPDPNQTSDCPIEELDGVAVRPMTLPMPPGDPCEPYCELFLSGTPALVFAIGKNPLSDSSIVVTRADYSQVTLEIGALDADVKVDLKDYDEVLADPYNPVKNAVFTYSYDGNETAGSTELALIE